MGQNNDVCQECLRYYNSGKTGGLNCAESTLKGVATYLGLESDAIYRIATPLAADWRVTAIYVEVWPPA